MEHTTLQMQLYKYLISRSVLTALTLVSILLVSAVGVIHVVHLNRQLYGELQSLQKNQDFLDHEYEKLLLEQSAWSEYSRVEKISHSKLAMRIPAANEIVMVKESGR
ncbi:MAG: cell division protein FtsL [Gammaproteobacteria bacterium]|nr:cell division protein FtsL [Gammaproteobacteria bacterium]